MGAIYTVNTNQVKEDMLKLEDSESNSVSNASRISVIAEAIAEKKKDKENQDRLNLDDESQSQTS